MKSLKPDVGVSSEEFPNFDPLSEPILDPFETNSKNPHFEEGNLFECVSHPLSTRIKQIWAIGGGKGGVGKSLVASSLAIALTRLGNDVVAIDLDLGGANLHTTLGVDLPKQTLSDFFSGREPKLSQCTVPTSIPGLSIISGAQDSMGVVQLDRPQKIRLLEKVLELDTDYIVFDLGAGTGYNTLDFFLFADIGIVILLPEPTSIENAYRFIKSNYYRKLSLSKGLKDVRHLIEMAMDMKNPLGIRSPSDLFREINQTAPEASLRLKQEIEKFRFKLIVNQARNQTDIDIGYSVKAICKKYFGFDMDYVGYMDYDSAVWQAIRRKRPVLLEFPNSRLVSSIEKVVLYLTKKHANIRMHHF